MELSIALHKHAMYPGGHPSLEPAAEAVVRRATRLFEDRDRIALGVARRQLIIEGVATDANQPVLRRLAETLHRQHLGAVTLERGIEALEVGGALRVLAADAEGGDPLGLAPAGTLPAWPHLQLHPLTFDRLALVAADPSIAADRKARFRGAELWIGLARAALAGQSGTSTIGLGSSETPDDAAIEPAVVAKAIEHHPRAEAYDQVIVGYLLQIARELEESSAAEVAALRRRTARLIADLSPETLRRLVEMGGSAAERRNFVLQASHGMAVEAVLEILRAASEASGQTISHSLMRMLTKLAAHAELGAESARPLADAALREQVSRLLEDWRLADPNPEVYRGLLHRVSTRAAAGPVSQAPPRDGTDAPDPLRVVEMSLEIGATGAMLDRAIDRAVDEGALSALLALLDSVPREAGSAADRMREKLVVPGTITRLLARRTIDFDSLDRLLPGLPADSFGPLLDALATSENRGVRRKLLDRLSRVEADISSLVTARLYDDRWFVQRNMLVLLERSGRAPEGFSASAWTEHLDPRVRHQAIRFQLTLPHERDHAIRAALHDGDPRLARLGLVEIQRECPPDLAGRVAAIAENVHADEEQRLLAVHALGRCDAPEALEALLRLLDGGKTLIGRPRLPPRTPIVVAAIHAIAGRPHADARVAAALALAARSADPEMRRAAGRPLP